MKNLVRLSNSIYTNTSNFDLFNNDLIFKLQTNAPHFCCATVNAVSICRFAVGKMRYWRHPFETELLFFSLAFVIMCRLRQIFILSLLIHLQHQKWHKSTEW